MAWSIVWGYDGQLVFGKGHLHIGGVDLRLYRQPAGAGSDSQELLCTTTAVYGSGWDDDSMHDRTLQPAGNELGYVVKITPCEGLANSSAPVYLNKGDILTVEARYFTSPWYEGVMGLLDIAVAPRLPPLTQFDTSHSV
eukprot:scaffold323946_cov45-Prasinocladus_malaysianus.AAC.2